MSKQTRQGIFWVCVTVIAVFGCSGMVMLNDKNTQSYWSVLGYVATSAFKVVLLCVAAVVLFTVGLFFYWLLVEKPEEAKQAKRGNKNG